MKLLRSTVRVGASQPFEILHISDTHLTLADERNDKRKRELAQKRARSFPEAEELLQKTEALFRATGAPVVHTGDLIDFVSEANLDRARRFTSSVRCFTAAGNHEFSLYVGEAKEDAAYREQSLAHVQTAFTNDIRFSSVIINGVNFVAIDNSYYLFEKRQTEALKKEVEKGFPVILCVHTPFYTEELFERLKEGGAPEDPAYLMSVPEEKMKRYTPDRYEQQKEDGATHEAYEYVLRENGIKAILTGHVHCDFALPFGEKMQYAVGCTDIRRIRIE